MRHLLRFLRGRKVGNSELWSSFELGSSSTSVEITSFLIGFDYTIVIGGKGELVEMSEFDVCSCFRYWMPVRNELESLLVFMYGI